MKHAVENNRRETKKTTLSKTKSTMRFRDKIIDMKIDPDNETLCISFWNNHSHYLNEYVFDLDTGELKNV